MGLYENYSKVHIGKHVSDIFPVQNNLKQGDALLPLLLNFALECSRENCIMRSFITRIPLQIQYSYIDKVKEDESEHAERIEEKILHTYVVSIEKPEGKRPLVRPRRT
jgi:hypothetical protein